MSEYLVKGEKLTALGEAIREQTGKTGLLTLEAMVVEIKNIDFSKITPINVIPDTVSSFTYDGTVKTPVWQNYDSEQLIISGTTSATNAGTHTVYFTPKAGYSWADESVDSKSVTWSIGKQAIGTVPSQSGTLTYSGSNQSPSWSNYSSSKLTIGGTTSGTNAGSYTATFTPTSNYKWSDNTTAAKSVTWSIAKASGSLSLSATSGTLYEKTKTTTFTVTRSGDGKISVSSSNTGIATASISGTTVTVKAVAYGSATITVTVAEGTNHKSPSSKTYSIKVESLYLYNAGEVNSGITGGWQNLGKTYSGGTMGAQALTIENITGGIKLSQGGGGKGGLYVTKNKIPLDNYSSVRFTGTIYRDYTYQNRIGIVVLSSIGNNTEDNAAAKFCANTGTTNFNDQSVVNISSLTGSYYIGFYINSSDSKYIELKKLRLE